MEGQVDYKKLWKLLIDKDIKKKTDLIPLAGISTNILAKMNKGEFVSMESIQKVCKALDCDVGDICVINKREMCEDQKN
ncbi:MAG: helix-turn-helix transcriptional regulator [Candidatus Treponema excrementipullorum]|uniref:Helix-turn-helix transcriptional regulator n=1 Tax=Candidatus Treponema excrementipullorum TaxID=2838768 RepID=A0A9E2L297_9SPIR|nr:helix-turn-helix transcriptional regulator [Candidatus Treponema excrementipullorum]MCI6479150.1 helix-turn-helix transcriptional regulator [Spirochaetia bacterium]MCI7589126.1 helix-turn-helix transcriptional regulator [Spirochaetia bacterium]MDD7012294.1 helix-turn-helix transcriptional regulator [Candidatus Treponema excrementipullorum]MDY4464727.1 helix-turn-helix transcriptional regulator [Candidatus Treponema excrementipullorum]